MKGVWAVAAAGLAAAAIFLSWRAQSRRDTSSLDAAAVQVERLIQAMVEGGPAWRGRYVTLVLAPAEVGEDPLELIGRRGYNFIQRLTLPGPGPWLRAFGDDDRIVAAVLPPAATAADPVGLEDFSRMLATAHSSGLPLRIVAFGEAAGYALTAAQRAAALSKAAGPVAERVVGVGVNLETLRAYYPQAVAAEAPIGEWNALWGDPIAVPRTYWLEVRGSKAAEAAAEEHPWPGGAWPAVVERVVAGGAPGAKPERPFRNREGRVFTRAAAPGGPPAAARRRAARSSLDMIRGAERPEPPLTGAVAAPQGRFHPIAGTPWETEKLPNFEYMTGHNAVAFFAEGPYRYDIWRNEGGQDASAKCADIGKNAAHYGEERGDKLRECREVATPETGRPQAHHDYFSIYGPDYTITVGYMYSAPVYRDDGAQLYHRLIKSLRRR